MRDCGQEGLGRGSVLGGKIRCSASQGFGHNHERSNQKRLGLKPRYLASENNQGLPHKATIICWRTRDPVGPGTEQSSGGNEVALTVNT